MWGIIKKMVNSTLGTNNFQPLDSLINNVINKNEEKSLREIMFDKIKPSVKEFVIDSIEVANGTTVESKKRLYINADTIVNFKLFYNVSDDVKLIVYKNGERLEDNSNIQCKLYDYFEFQVKKTSSVDPAVAMPTIYMTFGKEVS